MTFNSEPVIVTKFTGFFYYDKMVLRWCASAILSHPPPKKYLNNYTH